MKQKKLLALGMATLMAMSSSVMAFAEDVTVEPATGSVAGSGTLEGFVEKDVFTVTLPTTSTVNFKLDPQELVLASGNSSSLTLDGNTLTEGYGSKLLFTDANGNFLSKSANIAIVNKSTFDVDVTVGATLTGLANETDGYDIKVLDPTNETFGSETAITMAITPSENTINGDNSGEGATPTEGTAKYLTADANGISFTQTIAKSDDYESAYKVTYDSTTSKYLYNIDSTAAAAVSFNEVVFNLSGEVNTDADWTKFSEATTTNLKVDITYSVSKHSDVPVFTTGDAVGTIAYTTGSGDSALASITSITMKATNGNSYDCYNAKASCWAAASDSNGIITFASGCYGFYTGTSSATITYKTVGGDDVTCNVDVTWN